MFRNKWPITVTQTHTGDEAALSGGGSQILRDLAEFKYLTTAAATITSKPDGFKAQTA